VFTEAAFLKSPAKPNILRPATYQNHLYLEKLLQAVAFLFVGGEGLVIIALLIRAVMEKFRSLTQQIRQ